MTEYKCTIIGDNGTYDSIEEWQRAERPVEYFESKNELTLLDKFAMTALQGLCVNEKYTSGMGERGCHTQIAEKAYAYARAMIRERESK